MIQNRPLHLLIGEDNEADVFLLRHALGLAGLHYEATIATTGAMAISLIKKSLIPPANPFDGIILDLNLVTHSGLEILAEIREIPALLDTPILVFTSSEAPEDRDQARQLGASAYMLKPMNLPDFITAGREIADHFTAAEGLVTQASS